MNNENTTDHAGNSAQKASTGAIRSKLYETGHMGHPIRLDLILLNGEMMRRIAETLGEGAVKYGNKNWMKGFPESVLLSHLMEHLIKFMEGDITEDNLAHAAWNLNTLMWIQRNRPDLLDVSGYSGSWPPPVPMGMTIQSEPEPVRTEYTVHYFPVCPTWLAEKCLDTCLWEGAGWYVIEETPFSLELSIRYMTRDDAARRTTPEEFESARQ